MGSGPSTEGHGRERVKTPPSKNGGDRPWPGSRWAGLAGGGEKDQSPWRPAVSWTSVWEPWEAAQGTDSGG